jgi:hypothetical protein
MILEKGQKQEEKVLQYAANARRRLALETRG